METVTTSLKERWEALKAENPMMRIKNAAIELGVSEAELLATRIGEGVTYLSGDFKEMYKDISTLGYVMALTRNEDVVHERKGEYLNGEFTESPVGLFVGEDIDLRIFMFYYKHAFAVVEGEGEKQRKSIQFFLKNGLATHKVYMVKESNHEAYDAYIEKYKAENQNVEIVTEELPATPAEKPDSEIDAEGFKQAWLDMTDTHQFFGMTKKYGVSRTQALRLAPEGNYAVKVDNSAMRNLLIEASNTKTPIMVFVGNPGMIQIHTGPVNKLLERGEWYNVIDPTFNLHVRETAIDQTWVVRKPTEDGIVTSLELFSADGTLIATFFGKRKPGIPEDENWRKVVETIESK